MIKYERSRLKLAYRAALIAHCTGIAALGLYFFIGAAALPKGSLGSQNQDASNMTAMRYILYALSFIHIISVNYIKKFILKKSDKNIAPEAMVSKLRAASMVCMAVSEAPAIYGLVLSFNSRIISDMYLPMGLALLGLIIYFPRYEKWEEEFAKRNIMLS